MSYEQNYEILLGVLSSYYLARYIMPELITNYKHLPQKKPCLPLYCLLMLDQLQTSIIITIPSDVSSPGPLAGDNHHGWAVSRTSICSRYLCFCQTNKTHHCYRESKLLSICLQL